MNLWLLYSNCPPPCLFSVLYYSYFPLSNVLMLSHPVESESLQPHGLQPGRLLCPWDSSGKNTVVGCHFLLQGIFPTQGSNSSLLCLLHWQGDSLPLVPNRDMVSKNSDFWEWTRAQGLIWCQNVLKKYSWNCGIAISSQTLRTSVCQALYYLTQTSQ